MKSMEWIQLTGIILHGNIYLWMVMKKSSVSRTRRLTYFQILCYPLERWARTHNQILFGNNWRGSKVHHNIEFWTQLTESRWNSSGRFSQDSPLCSSSTVQEFLSKMSKQSEGFTGRIIFMSMFNDISWDLKTMNGNAMLMPRLCLYCAKRFPAGRWSFLGPGSGKKWYSTCIDRPQGGWDRVAELMMIRFKESGHQVFRAMSPLSRGTLKNKGGGKLSEDFCADGDTIEIVVRTIVSVNQLSIYGAVSDLCKEYSACHVRTRRPMLAGQSDPLFEPASSLMTTPTSSTEVPAQEDLLQEYKERVERVSPQNRVNKICTDAGFQTTVEVGQYFMTKDTEEFSQFSESVACREYILPRDEKSSDPKGWVRGNTNIGPVLEVPTSYLQGKYGVEIKFESVNKDNCHSWVRIYHGLNELVTDLSNNKEDDNNEQETSQTKSDEFALKTNVLSFASRSKAEAKPRRSTSACSSTRIVPICERLWTDIEPEDFSPIAYPVSKQLSTLLRHGHFLREEDGATEFWRWKYYLRNDFVRSQHWSDEMWKSTMAKGGGNKKRFQCCTNPSGQEILYLRALQGHSGRNPIEPSLQDNVLIPNDFFEYIYHIGCAINLHSIMNSGLIPGDKFWAKDRRYSSRLWILWTKNTEIQVLDLEAPRLARYQQKKWKKHQNMVYWVDIKLAEKKWFKFDQTRSNAIILHDTLPACCIPILYDTLPACCIPKAIVMELENTRKYVRHLDLLRRSLSKIIGWKNWVQKLLEVVQTPNKPAEQPSGSSAQEIDKRVLFDCESTIVRTGRLVSSCVPVSVERLDQDKDADENVDADQIRTERHVEVDTRSLSSRK